MQFFTPELYMQFNSKDDEEAVRADAAWEEAIRNYRHHLEAIQARMPVPVEKLASLCLHDAEIVSRVEESYRRGPDLATSPFPSSGRRSGRRSGP